MTLFLISLLFTSLIHADGSIRVERDHSQNLWLSGSCYDLKSGIDSIKKWNHSAEQCPVVRQSDNNCQANISKCLPSFVQNTHGKYPKSWGPNCFNLAFLSSNLNEELRYIDEFETQKILKDHCSPVSENDRKPGDIGIIYENGVIFHAFVWISQSLVFTKNGATEGVPYTLSSWTSLKSFYKFTEDAEGGYFDYSDYLSQFPDVPKSLHFKKGEVRYFHCKTDSPPFSTYSNKDFQSDQLRTCARCAPEYQTLD